MIKCLVPDLPNRKAIGPYLDRIDEARIYTNNGPLLRQFENRAARILDLNDGRCLAVSSATAGLELALRAIGIGPGHVVAVPAYTFPATALAPIRCGARVVFADIDPATWTITPDTVNRLSSETKIDAVIPVATAGRVLECVDWEAFKARTKISVLFDAAPGFGNQPIPETIPVVFSFHATKPIGIGEGGLVAARDATIAEKIFLMRNFGFANLVSSIVGTNAKLSEFAAAVGLVQLERMDEIRARLAVVYDAYCSTLGNSQIRLQAGFSTAKPPALLTVSLPIAAETVGRFLNDRGIETRAWYCPTLDRHPAIKPHVAGSRPLTATSDLNTYALGLPYHTSLSNDEIAEVCNCLIEAVNTSRHALG